MATTLYCATANPGKLVEFRLAAPSDLQFVAVGPFDCPETGRTFEENAVQKALCYARHVNGLVFADDSGLEVDLLGGAPGIHSARYAGPGATDEQNRVLLLENLRPISGGATSRPRARFVCVVALALPERLLATFHGTAEGEILDAPRGTGGFGYDPLFYYPAFGATFAEVTAEAKRTVSHRGQAMARARQILVEWANDAPASSAG